MFIMHFIFEVVISDNVWTGGTEEVKNVLVNTHQ